jgi:hypothetical protein
MSGVIRIKSRIRLLSFLLVIAALVAVVVFGTVDASAGILGSPSIQPTPGG